MEINKPEETFGAQFRMISNAIDKQMNRKRIESGEIPTRAQGGMIRYLIEHEDESVCQKDLEQFFHISGATATRMLNSMEKNGVIKRVPDKKDGRRKQIVLTQKAIEQDQRVKDDIIEMERNVTLGFTEEEVRLFRQMLNRVLENLSDSDEA